MRAIRPAFLLLIGALACRVWLSTSRPLTVRFGSGDSVLFVATGPIYDPAGDTGLMYEYHPYIPIQDTAQLRVQALKLWKLVQSKADSLGVSFAVLRATTRFTELPVRQPDTIYNFGFGFQKWRDGQWHYIENAAQIQH